MTPVTIDQHNWLRNTFINRLQTLLLLLFIGGYLALLGWLLWGAAGVFWLLILGGLWVVFAPTASPQLILRLTRARPLAFAAAPVLYRQIEELARRAELPRIPDLYLMPGGLGNAFAVGSREQAVIVVTEGLLRCLDQRELTGVLAHEISHIRNNDIRVMSLAMAAGQLTGVLSTIGQVLLLVNLPLLLVSDLHLNWSAVLILLLAPTASSLAQLGLSRVREYEADLSAATLTGDPDGLARALLKTEQLQQFSWRRLLIPGARLPEHPLLRSHPPTSERVRRLQELHGPEYVDHSHPACTGIFILNR
ncbi:zinc metalloprotease HtpX [Geothermobacter hydrogeniphilus]|uniref:Peptidase M48 n=1 Tax=Geothermobacter hydrogeniphilus TaxID=1969733 RepID=A0A1X0XK48_9BACT|nr:zinc metalloprotease HtpX [Geothermobacter hydrogeniphilus]ORJ53217.1 peptidase M48 [Geothermobacter hydrogeniphilus]